MKSKTFWGIAVAVIMAVPIMTTTSLQQDSFSADMIQKLNGQRIEGKIFVKGNKYRMDMTEEGEEISIIVDVKANKTKLLVHSQKILQEISNTSLKSLSNNPFEAFRYSSEKYETIGIGSEIINDYECRKTEIYDKEKKLMTVWISDELDWPVKIVFEVEPSREMELINIKEAPVEESRFQLPSGYKVISTPGKEETKGKISSSSEKKKILSKERTLETEGLNVIEKVVFKKLEEKNIAQVTKEGTIQLREKNIPIFKEYFPGWKFFRITREKEIQGGTSFSYVPVDKVAVHEESKTVLIISSPATDMPLENGLTLVQKENILLKSKEDAEEFAKVLDALYFKNSKVQDVESPGEGQWAVYTGTFINHLKGFLIKVDSRGKIIELNYSLKIKEK